MKTHIKKTSLIIYLPLFLFLFLFLFFGCQKHDDNHGRDQKHCYVTKIKTGNDVLDVFYNPDHTFKRSESYTAGNHGTRFVTEFVQNGSPGSFLINYDSYINDVKVQHFYATAAVSNDRITNLVFYKCTDCSVTPTTYQIDYSELYTYNNAGQMIYFETRDENNILTSHSDMEYDSKGRFSKETDYDEAGDLQGSFVYQYAASDDKNYSTGEFDVTSYIFHGSRIIQPLTINVYNENNAIANTVTYINTPNTEGYLGSAAFGSGTIPVPTTTYSYECE